ncbi:MAG: hypothetical protein ABI203_03160, partial [Mucilaginibacter sp.]
MRTIIILLIAFVVAKPDVKKRSGPAVLPNIQLYDLHGKHTTLAALSKGKITFIDNWFIPCPPCFREMGMLHKLYFKYRGNPNVNFITICRTDSGIVKKFIA